LARTVYIHRIFGDFPAKNTVYTPYIYGSGQPYIYGIFGRETTKYTVIYGAYIRFWPTLIIPHVGDV